MDVNIPNQLYRGGTYFLAPVKGFGKNFPDTENILQILDSSDPKLGIVWSFDKREAFKNYIMFELRPQDGKLDVPHAIKHLPNFFDIFMPYKQNIPSMIELLLMIGSSRVANGSDNGMFGKIRFIDDRPHGAVFRDVSGQLESIFYRYFPPQCDIEEMKAKMGKAYCNAWPNDVDCRCLMRHMDEHYNTFVKSLVYNASTITSDSCWFLPCKNANLHIKDPELEPCTSSATNCSIIIDADKLGGDLSIYNNSFNIEGCPTSQKYAAVTRDAAVTYIDLDKYTKQNKATLGDAGRGVSVDKDGNVREYEPVSSDRDKISFNVLLLIMGFVALILTLILD